MILTVSKLLELKYKEAKEGLTSTITDVINAGELSYEKNRMLAHLVNFSSKDVPITNREMFAAIRMPKESIDLRTSLTASMGYMQRKLPGYLGTVPNVGATPKKQKGYYLRNEAIYAYNDEYNGASLKDDLLEILDTLLDR